MKKITGLIVLLAAVLVAMPVMAEMEEKDQTYLYNEYKFEFPSSTGGVFLALTFISSGKEVHEKGIKGLSVEIVASVVGRWIEKDRDAGVDEYIITIMTHPYNDPENSHYNLPCLVLTYGVNKADLVIMEGLMTASQSI